MITPETPNFCFFKDKTGVDLSSTNGKRMEILAADAMATITDIEPALSVPGKDSSMAPVVSGDYSADYHGIKYLGTDIVKWSSCCSTP